MKTKKRLLSILLSLVMVLGLMPGMSLTVYASETWGTNTTIDSTRTINGGVTVNDNITLTINNGVTLTVKEGISGNNTLTVTGGGRLIVYGSDGNDGGDDGDGGDGVSGNVTVNSGLITVTGGSGRRGGESEQGHGGDGGDGGCGVSGNVTVNSGSITVTGGSGGFGGDSIEAEDGSDGNAGRAVTGTISYTVTYKVVGGTWSNGSSADKTETVQDGSQPASVPTGMKASEGYTGGSWDTDPANATINEAKTFTYTFTAKPAATVTKAPTAKSLTYTGSAQELVTAGEASGGTMQYTIGDNTTKAPTAGWDTSIPTAANVGTYYVWYKAKGDGDHIDSAPGVVSVTIKESTSAHTHTFKLVEAKEPTCTEDGYDEHYECPECGAWFEDRSGHHQLSVTEKAEITKKATGHKWDSGVVTKEATYDETGIKTYTCSVCGETKEETIPKKTRSYSNDSDNDSSDSGSSGGGSRGKSGSFSTQSLDVNGNAFGGPSAGHQPDSGMPVSDRGGNWGSMSNNWSYTKSDGTLAKNEWLNLEYNGHTYWYFFDGNSTMQTDWLNYNGATYYFVPDMDGWRGRMATGWHQIGEKWYYFEPTAGAYQGVMYRGAVTPDGHIVGADGAWNGVGTTPESSAQTGTTANGT